MVGISADRLDAYPHQLSGGMRQRVMICMALALRPEIVIMDEPTTALDVVVQRQILAQLVELREQFGFSVVFITHDLSLLVEFSDRIAIMYGGRIVEEAPPRPLCTRTRCTPTARPAALVPRAARPAPRAHRHRRLAAGPARHADRLRVPSAMPQGVRPVRRGAPRARAPVDHAGDRAHRGLLAAPRPAEPPRLRRNRKLVNTTVEVNDIAPGAPPSTTPGPDRPAAGDLPLGRGHLGLPDRGCGRRGRAHTVHLGHLLPGTRARSTTATTATSPATTTTGCPRTSR